MKIHCNYIIRLAAVLLGHWLLMASLDRMITFHCLVIVIKSQQKISLNSTQFRKDSEKNELAGNELVHAGHMR